MQIRISLHVKWKSSCSFGIYRFEQKVYTILKKLTSQFTLLHRQMKPIFWINFNSNFPATASELSQVLILVLSWTLVWVKTRKFFHLSNKKSVPDQLASFTRQEVAGVSMLLLVRPFFMRILYFNLERNVRNQTVYANLEGILDFGKTVAKPTT